MIHGEKNGCAGRGNPGFKGVDIVWRGGMAKGLLELKNVSKVYKSAAGPIKALNDVSLKISAGEFISITGPNGSGKSTLLHILGCLDRATKGEAMIKGVKVNDLSRKSLAQFRSKGIGFVFQSGNLVPRMSVLRNIMLPAMTQQNNGSSKKRALDLLERFDLSDLSSKKGAYLSGGEAQRVAIAMALINEPEIVLADEPTTFLDSYNSENIIECLRGLNEDGITVIYVSHDQKEAEMAKRTITLRDGSKIKDEVRA